VKTLLNVQGTPLSAVQRTVHVSADLTRLELRVPQRKMADYFGACCRLYSLCFSDDVVQ
jgi:hypothetical protein